MSSEVETSAIMFQTDSSTAVGMTRFKIYPPLEGAGGGSRIQKLNNWSYKLSWKKEINGKI